MSQMYETGGCLCTKSTNKIIHDDEGNLVCSKCGVIVGVQQPEGSTGYNNNKSSEKNSTTLVTNSPSPRIGSIISNRDLNGRILALAGWQRLSSRDNTKSTKEEKRRALIRLQMDIISTKLHIPKSVLEQAYYIYIHLASAGRGRPKQVIAAACMYAACKENRLPHIISEISSSVNAQRKQVTKFYTHIIQEYQQQDLLGNSDKRDYYTNIKNDVVDNSVSTNNTSNNIARVTTPETHVPLLCSKINFILPASKIQQNKKFTRDIQTKVEHTTCKLLESISDIDRAGKRPRVLAASAIYAACRTLGLRNTLLEIAELSEVSEVSIRNTNKKFFLKSNKFM